MLDIHIGPGRLGLGLILPCLRQAGIDVCLVGRADADAPEQRRYLLDSTDPDIGLENREVAYACNAGCVADLPEAVRAYAASDQPLLLTCALGADNATGGGTALLVELIEQRPAGAETVVVFCENDRFEVYVDLEKRYADRATFCWSVVDRLCTWLDSERKRDRLGRRMVRAHPVGEWVIGHPDPARPLMQALARAEEVRVVPPAEIPGFKDRKLWTVNGLHLVLAIIARRRYIDAARSRTDLLPLAARRPQFQQIAERVVAGIDAGLAHRYAGISAEGAYASDRVRAFCETPDEIERVLGSLVRSDLTGFMRRFDERICEAARAAKAAGADVTVFRAIVALTIETLKDRRCYYGPHAAPDGETDLRVVEAFRHALRDWLPMAEREERVRQLARILEVQRDDALRDS